MNAPVSRSSIFLLVAGTAMILLVGAFSRFGSAPNSPEPPLPTLGDSAEDSESAANEPSWPAGLAPGLAEIVRLAQAHLGDDVILDYIKNSGQTYSPSADDILYLTDVGLSPRVLTALMKEPLAETAAPIAPPPSPGDSAAQTAGADFFYKDLAPYGSWTQVPDYGLCWQPTVETINPDWRPYVDQGQWLYTDSGWFWQSQYSWGWAPFHYGRWSKQPRLGWVWVPDQVWGPAWVAWRNVSSYSGWAPLPPGVGLDVAAGLTFRHQPVGPKFDFGLPPGWFTFVSAGNFLSQNISSHLVTASQAASLYPQSASVNNYFTVNHKVVNLGMGREWISTATHQPVKEIALHSGVPTPEKKETLVAFAPMAETVVSPNVETVEQTLLDQPANRQPWTGNPAVTPAPRLEMAAKQPHRHHYYASRQPGVHAPAANPAPPHPPPPEPTHAAAAPPVNAGSKTGK